MIIKITPDKERAKSILKMTELREEALVKLERIKAYPTIIAENYYEIMKELCTAIGLVKGYKTVGENAHKEIINFVKRYLKFEEFDIEIMQDLRIRRNKSSYEGKPIEEIYLENKKTHILNIIIKLRKILNEILET